MAPGVHIRPDGAILPSVPALRNPHSPPNRLHTPATRHGSQLMAPCWNLWQLPRLCSSLRWGWATALLRGGSVRSAIGNLAVMRQPAAQAAAPGTLASAASSRPPTLREHAVTSIRRAILSGALAPGARIVEEDLATQLDISRGPVREAIRQLEQEGLVRSEPHRASYVAVLSEEEIEHLYVVRAEVEAIAARRVVQLVAEDRRRLEPYQRLLEQMRAAAAVRDLETLAAADLDLHRQLLEDSGYTILPRVWQAMDGVVRGRAQAILAQSPNDAIVPYTAESHAPIVDALAGGDPEAADVAVRRHVIETRDLWAEAKR
jgi:DNA-binding GntR family transcriptional regulator